MQPITKEEMELLIQYKILKMVKGRWQGLVIVGRHHNKAHKQRRVEPPIYQKLLELYKQLNLYPNMTTE